MYKLVISRIILTQVKNIIFFKQLEISLFFNGNLLKFVPALFTCLAIVLLEVLLLFAVSHGERLVVGPGVDLRQNALEGHQTLLQHTVPVLVRQLVDHGH